MVFDCRILYDKDGFMSKVVERVKRRLEEYGAERVYHLKASPFQGGERS